MSDKSHPNIVRIIELLEDEETYYVVLENVKGVELL
jgi:serine/threonine protein kinase